MSKDELKRYPSRYNKIGYTTMCVIPKKVCEHLALEGRGTVVWIFDEKANDGRALIMKG